VINIRFLLILSCILVFNACECLAQKKNEQATNQMNSGITNKDYSRLLAKAQAAGSIRIVARLDMPFVPDSLLSTQEAIDQQIQISRMQDQVCAALSKYNVMGIKRFKYTPYIAMEVDSTTLSALISNPLVLSLEEDVPVPPTTKNLGE
jgi:hypothetical protein